MFSDMVCSEIFLLMHCYGLYSLGGEAQILFLGMNAGGMQSVARIIFTRLEREDRMFLVCGFVEVVRMSGLSSAVLYIYRICSLL